MKNIKEFIERVFGSETPDQKKQRGETFLNTKDDDDWKILSYVKGDASKMFYDKYIDKQNIRYQGHLAEPNRPFKEIYYFAFLDRKSKQKIKSGLYIVYLLSADHSKLIFALAVGVTDEENRWNDRKSKLKEIVEESNFEKRIPENMEIGKKDIAKAYLSSIICYRLYKRKNIPENELLESDFNEMMKLYKKCLKENYEVLENSTNNPNGDGQEKNKTSGKELVDFVNKYITAHKFNLTPGMIENLYLSLKAKPFVILAGVSGTGKSKIVRLFAEAVGGKYKLIPVKPDWSDASDLLGHVDLDGNFIPGKLTDFLYEANKDENKDTPFFVCLDEMNLARVEYYFSDFLSVIETRHKEEESGRIITDRIFSGEEFAHDKTGASDKYGNLIISDNIYVIGTVNMDETTYPFSKKVLDRANTIEFSNIDLSAGLNAEEYSKQDPIYMPNSELKAKYIEFTDCYPSNYDDDIKHMVSLLETINNVLKEINVQIAYRVRNEIAFYLSYALEYKIYKYEQALDNELMQKILPRIQGSGRGTENALRGILNAIVNDHIFSDNELYTEVNNYVSSKNGKEYSYMKSIEKIQFMLRRLEQDGYTSYWL